MEKERARIAEHLERAEGNMRAAEAMRGMRESDVRAMPGRVAHDVNEETETGALRDFLRDLVEQDKVADDSSRRRVKPFDNTDDGEIRHLSPEECTRLVNAWPPDFRELVRGALYTGARHGELARMTVNHVNVEDARVFITSASESGKARHVPLSAEGATMFADLCAGPDGPQLIFRKADGNARGHNPHMRASPALPTIAPRRQVAPGR